MWAELGLYVIYLYVNVKRYYAITRAMFVCSICSRPEYTTRICHDPICRLFASFFLDRSPKREKNAIAIRVRCSTAGKYTDKK